MTTLLRLTLPWPPRELSPNARHAHWAALARAKRRYRAACALAALTQGAASIRAAAGLQVSLTFVPPDRRARDLDNLIASMKAGLDGLADVLRVDDRHWALAASTQAPSSRAEVRVVVSVLEAAEAAQEV